MYAPETFGKPETTIIKRIDDSSTYCDTNKILDLRMIQKYCSAN
jgi:hypothetical protein